MDWRNIQLVGRKCYDGIREGFPKHGEIDKQNGLVNLTFEL